MPFGGTYRLWVVDRLDVRASRARFWVKKAFWGAAVTGARDLVVSDAVPCVCVLVVMISCTNLAAGRWCRDVGQSLL